MRIPCALWCLIWIINCCAVRTASLTTWRNFSPRGFICFWISRENLPSITRWRVMIVLKRWNCLAWVSPLALWVSYLASLTKVCYILRLLALATSTSLTRATSSKWLSVGWSTALCCTVELTTTVSICFFETNLYYSAAATVRGKSSSMPFSQRVYETSPTSSGRKAGDVQSNPYPRSIAKRGLQTNAHRPLHHFY